MKREEVIRLFPERIRKILQQADWNPQGLQEIRLRAGKPRIFDEASGTGIYRIAGRDPKNDGDSRNVFPLCV